jgi:hypothetical protein
MTLTRITDDMDGAYCFRTSSGTLYLLDLDADPRHIVRLRGDRPPAEDYANLAVADLRKDGQTIPLLAVVELCLGKRGQLFLDVRGDGIPTYRDTTPLVSISPLLAEQATR